MVEPGQGGCPQDTLMSMLSCREGENSRYEGTAAFQMVPNTKGENFGLPCCCPPFCFNAQSHNNDQRTEAQSKSNATGHVTTGCLLTYLDPAGEAAWTPGQEQTPWENQLDDVIDDNLHLVPATPP